MTKQEGAIISAYTGCLCCEFGVLREYAEQLLGRAIFTHEFASDKTVAEIKEKSKADFMRVIETQI